MNSKDVSTPQSFVTVSCFNTPVYCGHLSLKSGQHNLHRLQCGHSEQRIPTFVRHLIVGPYCLGQIGGFTIRTEL